MKIRLTITALFLFFSCTVYGDQKVDLDSPEGWAMAFMTASAQNLGQAPPHAVEVGDISISAEFKLYSPPDSRAAKNWFWRF